MGPLNSLKLRKGRHNTVFPTVQNLTKIINTVPLRYKPLMTGLIASVIIVQATNLPYLYLTYLRALSYIGEARRLIRWHTGSRISIRTDSPKSGRKCGLCGLTYDDQR